jgi:hypothetical protein
MRHPAPAGSPCKEGEEIMKTSKLFSIIVALDENPELLDGDGHSILAPDYYTELGIPAEFLKGLEKTIKSNFKDHKQTIYVKGESVKSLKGIWNLDFLYHLALALGVEHDGRNKYGRGTQGRVICAAIRVALPKLKIMVAHSL